MHYSKLLLVALPFVAALPVSTITHVVTEYFTVTISANGQVFTQVSSSTETETFAVPTDAVIGQGPNQGPSNAMPAPTSTVQATQPTSSSVATSSSPAASSSASSGSTGGSGCPIDPSAPSSPGLNGAPAKSLHESINYIRSLYNPSAKCLGWSPSLADASTSCVQDSSESALRANSAIVSDNGSYGKSGWFVGPQISTDFESSMFTLLCQSPDDAQLQVDGKSGCKSKVGEIGCVGGACTGHHDALVDAAGAYSFVGAGVDMGTGWASTSFSATKDIFA